MFNEKQFSSKEWIIFLIVLLIPLVNIGFAVILIFRIGLIPLLIKLAIAFACYVVITLALFAILGFG